MGRIQAPKSKADKASEGADILTRETPCPCTLPCFLHSHIIQSIGLLCTDLAKTITTNLHGYKNLRFENLHLEKHKLGENKKTKDPD